MPDRALYERTTRTLMPDARETRGGPFQEARSAFEKLNTQDKVTFVVEATFAAVGQAIEEGGRHLASVLDDVAGEVDRSFRGAREPRGREEPPRPEQPPHEPTGGAPRARRPAPKKRPPPRKKGDG